MTATPCATGQPTSEKHNEANGEDNRDGHAENYSRNWGVEGRDRRSRHPRHPPGRAARHAGTVFASAGTPMLLAGDEMLRTQGGNNNAYNQDNETSWVDWTLAATPEAEALRRFTARLIALRHRLPPLRPATFLHGATEVRPGLNDIAWFDQHGRPMTPEAWNEPEARTLALRRAAAAPNGGVDVTLLLLNADSAGHAFAVPQAHAGLVRGAGQRRSGRRRARGAGEAVPVAARGAVLLAAELRWHDRLRAGDALGRDAARPPARTRFRLWAPDCATVGAGGGGPGAAGR